MKLEEPIELKEYVFLPDERRVKVDEFLSRLDNRCKDFALKRYLEQKNIALIAEEMGYSERNLFKFRRKIIVLWNRHVDRAS